LRQRANGTHPFPERLVFREHGDQSKSQPSKDCTPEWRASFDAAISADLATPEVLSMLEGWLKHRGGIPEQTLAFIKVVDSVMGLNLVTLQPSDLRIRPKSATITEGEIEAALAERREARAAKDFAKSDRLRDELAAQGVEVMDGDPLGWDWKL
jgi:cysteinyl-tRNA synthetase